MRYARMFCAMGAALAIALLLAVSPASAYPTSRYLYHYAPDAGVDEPIIVTCNWDNRYGHTVPTVAEGKTSSCKIEGVYVPSNRQIKCYGGAGVGWFIAWDATSWHKTNYAPLYGCVIQTD